MKQSPWMTVAIAAVLLLSFSATQAFPSQESPPQVSDPKVLLGTWDIEVIDMGFQMQFVFKIIEEVLSGELVFEMGSGTMTELKLEKNELSSYVELDVGGQYIGISITGTIDGDTITGFLTSDMGSVQYTGTKRKE